MKLIDLFAGMCGFSLAGHWLGWQTVGFVENNPVRQAGIRHEFGADALIIPDIRDVTRKSFQRADIITAGFPCQPFSLAGMRRGKDDNRYLWDETLRVIEIYKPAWFVGENVDGIFSMALAKSPAKVASKTIARNSEADVFTGIYTREEIMLVESICQDLESIGYEVQPLSIPSFAVNAWDKRQRCWLLAYSDDGHEQSNDKIRAGRNIVKSGDQTNFADINGQRQLQPNGKFGNIGRRTFYGNQKNTADLEHFGREKKRVHAPERQSKKFAPNGQRIPDWRHEWWETEHEIFSRNDGLPVRLDGCQMSAANYENSLQEGFGNAVNPAVAFEIFKAIVEIKL